jgi:hypothetical protein
MTTDGMNADYTPPVETDARNRGWRTLMQGLGLDVAVAAATALVAGAAGGVEWTRLYWIALGLAVAKSAVQGAISYFARKFVPPATVGA